MFFYIYLQCICIYVVWTYVTLRNIVSTVNLGCPLDLKFIALHARNAEYNPKVPSLGVLGYQGDCVNSTAQANKMLRWLSCSSSCEDVCFPAAVCSSHHEDTWAQNDGADLQLRQDGLHRCQKVRGHPPFRLSRALPPVIPCVCIFVCVCTVRSSPGWQPGSMPAWCRSWVFPPAFWTSRSRTWWPAVTCVFPSGWRAWCSHTSSSAGAHTHSSFSVEKHFPGKTVCLFVCVCACVHVCVCVCMCARPAMSQSCFQVWYTGWWNLALCCLSSCQGRWFWRVSEGNIQDRPLFLTHTRTLTIY